MAEAKVLQEGVEYVESAHDESDVSNEDGLGEQIAHRERDRTLWQAMRGSKRILLYSIAPFCAGMMFGYDSIVNGASISMPSFLIYYGSVDPATHSPFLPSIWASLWTAMSALLQAVGGFGIGYISDRVGRKWCCVASCFVSLGGVGMQYSSTTRGLLLGGKMVNGLAIGCLTAASTAWASEISPTRLRGPIQSAIVLFTVVMQALGLVVIRCYVPDITPTSFRHVFAIQFVWAGVAAIAFSVVPESPNWLVLTGKPEAARRSLSKLYGSNNSIEARHGYLNKVITVEAERGKLQGAGSYLDAFRGSNRKRSLPVVWIFIGAGLNGASLLSQSIYFLIIAGLPPIHSYDVAIGGFGIAIIVIVATWFYMEKFGRRSLWLIGCAGNFFAMLTIGGLAFVKSQSGLWAIAVIMNILISYQLVTMVSVGWAITGEISAYRLRGKTQAIAVISNAFATWLFTFTVPYMYNVDAGNLGAKTGFVFAGGSVILFAVSFFIIPDLHGFNTEEVDWLYQSQIPVRHFQMYTDGRAKEGAATMVAEAASSQNAH